MADTIRAPFKQARDSSIGHPLQQLRPRPAHQRTTIGSHDQQLQIGHRRRISNLKFQIQHLPPEIRSGPKDGSPHLVQDPVDFINADHLRAVQAMTVVGFHESGTGRTTASTDRSQEPISLAAPDPATQNPPARRPHPLPSADDSRSRQRSEHSSHDRCSKPTDQYHLLPSIPF
ncbi:hypothetical protein ACLOJK_007749 [Asimina triloba]